MISLGRSEAVSCSNPALWFIAQREGKLEDLQGLSFEIFDVSTEAKRLTPAVVQGSTTVDVSTDCPVGGRVSTGRYVASWTVPADEPTGRHEIRWSYSWDGVTTIVARIEFEVLETAGLPIGPRYALVSDMLEEGVPATISVARIQTAIVLASRLIDAFTGRFFEPRFGVREYDGQDARALLFEDPVIAISSLVLDGASVELSGIKVYGRHLSGMTGTDDRESPKIVFDDDAFRGSYTYGNEYLRTSKFSRGTQNVVVSGVWGYTEDVHNGAPWGDTPLLIRHAAKLLALREIPTLRPTPTDSSCREDLAIRTRIIEEKTRDQSYKLDTPRKFGAQFTGDPEIDIILTMFTRPPAVGGA